jgi:hypothetical protein
VTPEEVFALHHLNACVEGGDICNHCLDYPWPCHAYLVACHAVEQREASAALVASLIAQRDACLDAM